MRKGRQSRVINNSIKSITYLLLVKAMLLLFPSHLFALNISSGYANTMACNGTLYDPGGTGNYSNNQSGYTVIAGKPGATINISGTYSTEANYDYVYIYSGAGIGGTLLGTYHGSGSVNYTGTAGQTLTVRFTSDGGVTGGGFAFNIAYSSGGACPGTTLVSGTSSSVPCGTSALLLDHAGDGLYSNNRTNDYTVLNSIGSAAINVWGAYATESGYDYVRIYSGAGIGGTLRATYSGDGIINYTGTAGETLTVRFTSDGGVVDGGFSLIASTVGPCSVPYEATYTSMSTGSSTWCVGETRNVSVTIQNSGTNAWTDGGGEDFNIGVKWNADPDYLVRVDAQNLAPGASRTYTLSVTAPAAGSNNLTFNVVREAVAWFGGPYTSSAITIIDKPVCATASLSPGNGATGVCSNSVSAISWAAVAGATAYDVYFGTSASPPLVSTGQVGTSYATGALAVSQTYYWRVVPKNSCGSATGCSTYSFATAPAIGVPTSNAATAVSCNSFTANWGAVSGATSYRLDVSTSSGFGSFVSGYNNLTVAGNSQSVTGLSNGVTYHYRVRAVNACGAVSGNSGTISATTSAPANNICGTATALTINGSATTGDVNCASAGSGACSGSANYDVWYSFTTTCSGTYQVLVDPSTSFDAVFQLYGTCGGSHVSPVSGTSGTNACVDNGGNNSNEYATYSLAAGNTYYVRVYDYNTSLAYPTTTDFTIAVTAVSIAVPAQPSAISGPSSICIGSTASYSVTNVGGITYNWSLPSGWSGSSTTNSITIGTNGTSGTITVTANNACGSSPPRTLAVSAGVIPIANAGADASMSCAGALKLGASSNTEIIATEDFGNSNTEVTASSNGWRIKYLVGSSPGNRTEWWISNAANGFSCAVGGSSLAQFDTYSQYGPIKCDYAWDDGTMDEVAYRVAEIDAALYTKVYLTFDYLVSGEVSGSTVYDYMQVVYSTDGGTNWTPVNAGLNNSGTYNLNANRGVNNGYFSDPPTPSPVNTTIEFPSALAGNKFLFGFRWYNDGATGYIPGMVIDNIVVSGTADYNWGGGNIVFGGGTKTPVINQPGTYTVTVTAGNGCTASDQTIVTQGELNASVSGTNATVCNGQGSIDITSPSGGDQTWLLSSLLSAPANTSITGNAIYTGDRLRLTSASASEGGSFVISNPNNFNATALDLEYDFYFGGGTAADGFSISYAGNIPANPGGSESGHGSGLIISFDSYSNGTAGGYQYGGSNQPGIYLVYNGTVLAFTAGTAWRNAIHTARLSISSASVLTLYIDGVSVLTYNLGSTGYAAANKTGWTWAFSARTGGAFDEHSIRHLLLTVYDQYEYSIGSGWGTPSSFTVNAGNYTPQIRLKGGLCTKNLTPQAISSPSLTIPGQTFQTGDYVYSGASTAAWATAANWFVYNGSAFDVATVAPSATNNTFVYPASTHTCIVRSNVNLSGTNNAKDVNIKPGATINGTANNRTINVYGNWTNEGTFTMGNSTVAFRGAANTTASAGNSSFYKVTIDKTSTGAKVTFAQDFECTDEFLITRGTTEIPQDVTGEAVSLDVQPNGALILKQKTSGAVGGEFNVMP